MSDQFTLPQMQDLTLIKANTGIFDWEFYLITENKTRKHLWYPLTQRGQMASEHSY
jgi:hypothetical protein